MIMIIPQIRSSASRKFHSVEIMVTSTTSTGHVISNVFAELKSSLNSDPAFFRTKHPGPVSESSYYEKVFASQSLS